jgi:hypothetical protein
MPLKMSTRVALFLELLATPFFCTIKFLHAAPIRALQYFSAIAFTKLGTCSHSNTECFRLLYLIWPNKNLFDQTSAWPSVVNPFYCINF